MINIHLTNRGRHLGYQRMKCIPRPGDNVRFINAEPSLAGDWKVCSVTHVMDRSKYLWAATESITVDLV